MLIINKIIMLGIVSFPLVALANQSDFRRLKKAYPTFIQSVTSQGVKWVDGTVMPLDDQQKHTSAEDKIQHPSLYDQLHGVYYEKGMPKDAARYQPKTDPGRIRYEPFFRKMYGNTAEEVEKNLTTIYWLPTYFGKQYPLKVTRVNEVDKKLQCISKELEAYIAKHPDDLKYLQNPGGTFTWRKIANTDRLSLHSFGMTIDINSQLSNYWQWDLKRQHKPINESTELTYKNSIPWGIVPIFEKYGFIWGGKWYHYDTMHFEFRPELNLPDKHIDCH